MKVKTNCTGLAFPPITLTITIESEEELIALYHRFNIADKFTLSPGSKVRKPVGTEMLSHEVWSKLNDIIIRRGMEHV